MTEIYSKLKEIMDQKEVSQAELSRRTGCGDAQVSRWYKGTNVPGTKSLQRLAKALGVAVTDITGDISDHDCAKRVGIERIAPIMEHEVLLVELHRELDRHGVGEECLALLRKFLLQLKAGVPMRVNGK